jgi:MFS family permease
MNHRERARVTYFWDRVRGAAMGCLEPYWQTFALLIAIRVFAAPDGVKAILPMAFPIGFVLLPLTVPLAARSGLRVSVVCALSLAVSGSCLLASALVASLWMYVALAAASMIVIAQIVPFSTQIYAANYSADERGRLFSTAFLLSSIIAVIAAYAGGRLLDFDLDYYPIILVVAAASSFFGAFAFSRIPTEGFPLSSREPISRSIGLLWSDRLFGRMQFGWSIIALGAMMIFPIRVEYMANPLYNVNATNEQIGVVLGAVPLLARLVSTKVWGYLFDHFNVVSLRIALNLITFFAILLFFGTTNLVLMAASMMLYGVAYGGGRIMWQLWVTKIAPEEKVASYMTVNSTVTGILGLAAPAFGYAVLHYTNPAGLGWVAAFLLGLSTFIFLPARSILDRRGRVG